MEDAAVKISDLQDRLRLRSEECDLLRDDLKNSTAELVEMQSKLREGRDSLSRLTSEIIPLRHSVKTSEKKRELLESKLEAVEKRLFDQKQELSETIQSSSDATLDMEIKLRTALSDLDSSKRNVQSLEDLSENQNERILGFIKHIGEMESDSIKRQAEYEKTIDSKSISAQHYKHLYEDAMERVSVLEDDCATLRREAQSFDHHVRELERSLEDSRQESLEATGALREERRSLLDQVKRLQEEREEYVLPTPGGIGGDTPSSQRNHGRVSVIDSIQEEGLYDSHELFSRYSEAMEHVALERGKRKEAEQCLNRILRDVELKGPVIAKMKKDHSLLVQAHDSQARQMDSVLRENSLLRDQVSELSKDSGSMLSSVEAIRQQNKDLSAQVTSLLNQGQQAGASGVKSGAGVEVEAMDVVSSHLVTFANVKELQQRNMQLLQVVRRLAGDDVSDTDMVKSVDSTPPLAVFAAPQPPGASSSSATSAMSQTLSAALEELKNMRESRSKAENALLDVIKERDDLKALLAPVSKKERNSSPKRSPKGTGSSPLPLLGGTTPSKDAHAADGQAAERAASHLHLILSQLEARVAATTKRLEQANKERDEERQQSSAKLEALRGEMNLVKRRLAESEGEVSEVRERATRAKEEAATARAEYAGTTMALLESEKRVAEEKKESSVMVIKMKALEADLGTAEEARRFLETELAIAQDNENSALQQLAVMTEERRREGELLESVRSMEMDLVSKKEAEWSSVVEEKDRLSKEVARLRKELLDSELMTSSRVGHLEGELKRCSVVAEEKIEEAFQLRLGYTKQEGIARAATDRLALVEKQLGVTQERMAALQGMEKIEAVLEREGKAHEKEKDEALRKLSDARAQLKETEEHMEYFRKIGLATDEKMKAMQREHEVYAASQQKLMEEGNALVKSLQEQLRSYQAESDEVAAERVQVALLKKEVTAAADKKIEEKERDLQESKQETALIQQREDSQKTQISHLQQLVNTLSADLDSSKTGAAKLREEREREQTKSTELARALALSEKSVADLTADAVSTNLQHVEEAKKHDAQVQNFKEQVESLRRSNDILHAQIQTMGARISRYEAADAEGGGLASTTPLSDGAPQLAQEEGEGEGQDREKEQLLEDEALENRKTIEELRELVWLLKRERDALDTKVSAVDSEYSRATSALTAMQKSLEEARATLRRESEARAPTRAEADFAKLIEEVQQLNGIQEQVSEIKRENQRLTHINSSQFAELAALKSELDSVTAPKNAQIAKLSAAKATLEGRVEALNGEKALWTKRLQQLFDRYKDCNPEEFKDLKEAHDAMRENLAQKDAELASAQQSKLGLEKSGESLRNKMRQMKSQSVEMQRKRDEQHQKELDDVRSKVGELESALAAANAAATTPTTATATATTAATATNTATATTTATAADKPPEDPAPAQASVRAVAQEESKASDTSSNPFSFNAGAPQALTEKEKLKEMQRLKTLLKRNRSEREDSLGRDEPDPSSSSAADSGAGKSKEKEERGKRGSKEEGEEEEGQEQPAKRPRMDSSPLDTASASYTDEAERACTADGEKVEKNKDFEKEGKEVISPVPSTAPKAPPASAETDITTNSSGQAASTGQGVTFTNPFVLTGEGSTQKADDGAGASATASDGSSVGSSTNNPFGLTGSISGVFKSGLQASAPAFMPKPAAEGSAFAHSSKSSFLGPFGSGTSSSTSGGSSGTAAPRSGRSIFNFGGGASTTKAPASAISAGSSIFGKVLSQTSSGSSLAGSASSGELAAVINPVVSGTFLDKAIPGVPTTVPATKTGQEETLTVEAAPEEGGVDAEAAQSGAMVPEDEDSSGEVAGNEEADD